MGGALGVGSGTLRALALTTSATAAATGTTTAALTTAEQLHAGTFDATAIAHSGLRETARTLAMGIIAGGLARAFAAALSPVVYSWAKYLTQSDAMSASRAAMVHHDALVNSVIATLAGGGAGALTAAIEEVLAAQVGHPLSEAEFSKLVVEQLVLSGAYQTALAVAVRRTNSRFVDLRNRPIEEVLAGKHTPPPDHWGLYEVTGPGRTVSVLAQPRYLDHNGAIYDKKGLSKEVEAVHRALNNPTSTDNYVPNSLLIHTHGYVDRLAPGNKNVAHLTNRVLALPGMQNIDSVGARACSQVDARWPGHLSNAQVFEAELHQALSANNSPGRLPPVFTGSKPGETSAGQFTRDTPRPAAQGGIRTSNWYEYELARINDRALRKYYLFYATAGAATLMALRPQIARSILEWIGIGGPGGPAGASSDQEQSDAALDGDSPTGDTYSDLPRIARDEYSDRARQ